MKSGESESVKKRSMAEQDGTGAGVPPKVVSLSFVTLTVA